jgi:glycosyltransferase involved in cell wall biosynthesis
MRIALVAPPFIPVPPKKYGGTELFVAELAMGLQREGIDVTVYTNGESEVEVPIKWFYERGEWPLREDVEASLKGLNHSAWAIKDAASEADIIHLNSAPGLSLVRFTDTPVVYTVHHAFDGALENFYRGFPEVSYVSISDFQRRKMGNPRARTIHHGIDTSLYRLQERKQQYLSFLGRIAPTKGTHVAIKIAHESGIPLKIAGEIQPLFKDYWERQVKPHVDGKFIEYVGEVGLEEKNELLANSMAMLFPVQWDEPFGLVMIESMACGTPVLACGRGSVDEVVKEGVGGHVRATASELARCARDLKIDARVVRRYMEKRFSAKRMTSEYISLYTELAESPAGSEVEGLVA